MKYNLLIVIGVIILSCTPKNVNHLLNDVESYILELPDSALSVLENIDRNSLNTDRARAHHALLYAMALDKNYINVTDDSIARVAVDYYSKKGPEKYEARALYYLGLAYYYQQNYNQAILEFTKAEKSARICDSLYLGMTKSIQAHTYYETYNHTESLKCFIEALNIYSALSEYSKANSVKSKLINIHIARFEYEKAEEFLMDLLKDENMTERIHSFSLASKAFLNVVKPERNPEITVQTYGQLMNSDYNMTLEDYWAYAFALSLTGQKGESKTIVDQLSESDTSSSAYYWQYLISKYNNDYKQALTYLEESNFKDNEVITAALNQSLSLTQRDYYESQSELSELKVKSRTHTMIYTIIISVLIMVLISFIVSIYMKNQKEEKDRYINYADEISRQLKNLQIEADSMPVLKRKYIQLYKEKFESLRILCDHYLLYQDRTDAENKMYGRVVAMINEIRSDKESIGELEAILDNDLDCIMTRLRNDIKMKDIDYSIYAYLIIGFDATTISRLLDVSVNTVYIRKSRIKRNIEESVSVHKDQFLEMII